MPDPPERELVTREERVAELYLPDLGIDPVRDPSMMRASALTARGALPAIKAHRPEPKAGSIFVITSLDLRAAR
jgi:hypothetical protein